MRNLLARKAPEPPSPADERMERRDHAEKVKLTEGVRRGWWRKVDVSKLTLAEAEELNALFRKARGDGPYPVADTTLLDPRERRRAAELLDQCLPDAERELARKVAAQRAERELENLAIAALSAGVPPRLRAGIEPGEALLPREAVELRTLNVGDLGTLAVLLYAFSSGVAGVFKGGRFSEDGEALLLPKRAEFSDRALLVDFNADGTVTTVVNLHATLQHLTRNGFLDAQHDASGWTIRLGARLDGHR
jgi:hypothetical protein